MVVLPTMNDVLDASAKSSVVLRPPTGPEPPDLEKGVREVHLSRHTGQKRRKIAPANADSCVMSFLQVLGSGHYFKVQLPFIASAENIPRSTLGQK